MVITNRGPVVLVKIKFAYTEKREMEREYTMIETMKEKENKKETLLNLNNLVDQQSRLPYSLPKTIRGHGQIFYKLEANLFFPLK